MKKALIFGVTGQDGSYLAEFLIKKKYQVHGIKRRTSTPNTSRIDHIFGEGGVKAEAKKRGIEMLGEIPISSQVRKSSDSGIPIIISEPKSVQSKNYRNIAKSIIKSVKIDEEELV